MLRATMTLLGLYRADTTIFDGLQLPSGIDRHTIVDNLLLNLSGLEILYPDPNSMKYAIEKWSASRIDAWGKIYTAITAKYDPLNNYDRREEFEGSGDSDSTSKSPVYDDTTLVDVGAVRSNNRNRGSSHVYGNIGVTTSAQMLTGEVDVRQRFDFCNIVTQEFKERFCIMVY